MKYLDFTITDLPLVLSNKPVHYLCLSGTKIKSEPR